MIMDIKDTRLRRLYEFWLQRKGGRRFPSRRDIDPVEIRYVLGWVMLIDAMRDPVQFRTSRFTTLSRLGLPSKIESMFCTATTAMRSTASRVTPATCGAAMKLGRVRSGLSFGVGSSTKTSSAAPAIQTSRHRGAQRGTPH